MPPSLNKIIDKYITEIWEAFPNVPKEDVFRRHYYCIEICGIANSKIADPNLILEEFPKQVYGLLARDEGWRFVPKETAKERLQNKWQTRDFVDSVAFDKSVVFFNLHRQRYKEYQESQVQVREKYGIPKETDPETRIAGLNGGPLLNLENAALQFFMIDQISKKFGIERKKIKEIEEFRKELLDAMTDLSLVNQVIPEIDFLQKTILKAMGVPEAIKGLKSKLEEVESSLQLRYNQRFNTLIGYLTGVGVAIAILTVAIQLLLH